MNSTDSSFKIRRKAEASTMIEMLRKRTTRNVPLAGFYLTLALYFLFATYSIGTTRIGQDNFVPVRGHVTLALALCFIYAASMKLFVRTSDKVLKLLTEEVFKDDSEARVLTMFDKVQASHARRQEVEQVVPPNGP